MRYAALPIRFASKIKSQASSTRANVVAKTLIVLSFAAALSLPAAAQTAGTYSVTNLVSDGSVPATITSTSFINPWAMSTSGTWWVSTEGSGFNYVIQVPAPNFTPANPFKVIVPAFSNVSTAVGQPTGSVSTAAATGMLLSNGTKASFLFSTLDGTISGWNTPLGTTGPPTPVALIAVNNHAAGAVYTGMAIINNTAGSYLVVPNFGTANKIEVYDSTFKPATLSGGTFTDPNLPAGYSPYGVHLIGSQVFITYVVRSAAAPFTPVGGLGNGIVSVFDTTGKYINRIVTGGNLNIPWGVAIAPANFGIFSNDILIGNFGNGLINVYNPTTFAYLGQLIDGTGKPLTYATLWELLPGGTLTGSGNSSASGGSTSTVYFTAGLAGQAHGLLGGISSSSTSSGTATFGFSASTSAATVTAGNSAQATISAAPTNGFSGSVTLACSGLPIQATCTFSPSSLTVSASAPATGTVTIQTAPPQSVSFLHRKSTAGITYALLLPFASILIFRRRRSSVNASNPLRLLGVFILLVASTGFLIGCLSGNNPPVTNGTVVAPGTPTGTSTITITATSGSVSQTTTIALTVQ
jgi:uncharacterized protein (TIGR03118 family)